MTIADDTRSGVRAPSTATLPLVAKKPPKYAPGVQLVLKGYETGWRWTIVDATLVHTKKSGTFWRYTATAVRDYDGKVVQCDFPEWRLRPVPEVVA